MYHTRCYRWVSFHLERLNLQRGVGNDRAQVHDGWRVLLKTTQQGQHGIVSSREAPSKEFVRRLSETSKRATLKAQRWAEHNVDEKQQRANTEDHRKRQQ